MSDVHHGDGLSNGDVQRCDGTGTDWGSCIYPGARASETGVTSKEDGYDATESYPSVHFDDTLIHPFLVSQKIAPFATVSSTIGRPAHFTFMLGFI